MRHFAYLFNLVFHSADPILLSTPFLCLTTPYTLVFVSVMALNWVPPPNGTLKVNVHAVIFDAPIPNGNRNGMGIVLRTSNGNLVSCIAGVIPGLSSLENQLSAVLVGLRRLSCFH